MFSRQFEQLADQRVKEVTMQRRPVKASRHAPAARHAIRNHTGWTLVAIGLRIAQSGGR